MTQRLNWNLEEEKQHFTLTYINLNCLPVFPALFQMLILVLQMALRYSLGGNKKVATYA